METAILNFEGGLSKTFTRDVLNPSWAKQVEFAFTAAFAVELAIRILALEGAFFFGPEWSWNLFDTILVLTTLLETAFTVAGIEMTYIRLLRLLRMTRTT